MFNISISQSHMFRTLTRRITPLVAGTLAFGVFPLRKSSFMQDTTANNEEIMATIKQSTLFQKLDNDDAFTCFRGRQQLPNQHHRNLVTAGLLFGKGLLEIDPIIFDNTKGEYYSFNHIGDKLISDDGKVHNGITATLLDEGLCGAGFPFLPSKKGVTANLSINFENQIPPASNVVLKAKVIEHKGRKVKIAGSLQTLSDDPITIATATCVLVEPKWFKYFSWFQFI